MRLQSHGQEKDWNQGEPDSLVKKNVNVFNKCKVEVLVLNLTLYLYSTTFVWQSQITIFHSIPVQGKPALSINVWISNLSNRLRDDVPFCFEKMFLFKQNKQFKIPLGQAGPLHHSKTAVIFNQKHCFLLVNSVLVAQRADYEWQQ